jgi:hypothetical protein
MDMNPAYVAIDYTNQIIKDFYILQCFALILVCPIYVLILTKVSFLKELIYFKNLVALSVLLSFFIFVHYKAANVQYVEKQVYPDHSVSLLLQFKNVDHDMNVKLKLNDTESEKFINRILLAALI